MDCEQWLDLVDEKGAGSLAPQHCRENLLKAERLMAPYEPQPLHFAEFPLLGDPVFDMTWSVPFDNMAKVQSHLPELEAARLLAPDMDPDGIFMFEFDTSAPQLPPAGFYFKGTLADGGHAIRRMMECLGREDEVRGALLLCARLAKLKYSTLMCGVMAGRDDAPIRVTAKPVGEFDVIRLMEDLMLLGFPFLPREAFDQLSQICVPNEYMFSAPLIYLDLLPDGTLGPTLGCELSGIRRHNINDYPQLRLALDWGLADDRWEVLRDGSFSDGDSVFFVPNTLKFRWRNGEPLPVKLYMKAGW